MDRCCRNKSFVGHGGIAVLSLLLAQHRSRSAEYISLQKDDDDDDDYDAKRRFLGFGRGCV